MANESELGAFLRSRREQLRPADVGLPDTGRRRTPGLRREEVAALAGVSIDYLVRLEQGRDRNPSPSVVSALADALRLDPDERAHLSVLALCEGSAGLCGFGEGEAVDEVSPGALALLDRLDPTPALVVNPWYDVLARNEAWERVVGPCGMLEDPVPNLARYTFLDPRATTTYADWSAAADVQVGALRDAHPRWRVQERFELLVRELCTSPEFERRWRAHDVVRKRRGSKALVHPAAGLLRIEYEVLHLDEETDQRLIVWLPQDEATDDAFRRLRFPPGEPGSSHLRVVGD